MAWSVVFLDCRDGIDGGPFWWLEMSQPLLGWLCWTWEVMEGGFVRSGFVRFDGFLNGVFFGALPGAGLCSLYSRYGSCRCRN